MPDLAKMLPALVMLCNETNQRCKLYVFLRFLACFLPFFQLELIIWPEKVNVKIKSMQSSWLYSVGYSKRKEEKKIQRL